MKWTPEKIPRFRELELSNKSNKEIADVTRKCL